MLEKEFPLPYRNAFEYICVFHIGPEIKAIINKGDEGLGCKISMKVVKREGRDRRIVHIKRVLFVCTTSKCVVFQHGNIKSSENSFLLHILAYTQHNSYALIYEQGEAFWVETFFSKQTRALHDGWMWMMYTENYAEREWKIIYIFYLLQARKKTQSKWLISKIISVWEWTTMSGKRTKKANCLWMKEKVKAKVEDLF